MIRSVRNVRRRMRLYGTCEVNRTSGLKDRICSVRIWGIRMINLVLWRIGLGRELWIASSWWIREASLDNYINGIWMHLVFLLKFIFSRSTSRAKSFRTKLHNFNLAFRHRVLKCHALPSAPHKPFHRHILTPHPYGAAEEGTRLESKEAESCPGPYQWQATYNSRNQRHNQNTEKHGRWHQDA